MNNKEFEIELENVLDGVREQIPSHTNAENYIYANYYRPFEKNLGYINKRKGIILTFARLTDEDEDVVIRNLTSQYTHDITSGENYWLLSVINITNNPQILREELKPLLKYTTHLNYIKEPGAPIIWKNPTYQVTNPAKRQIVLRKWMAQ